MTQSPPSSPAALNDEAIAAQLQWIETGTVPVSYLTATLGASFSNRERPVTLSATNFEKKK